MTSPVRTDTGVREDIAVSAQFVPDESSGGGAAVGAWMRPPMVGSGARNVTFGAHQPLGSVLDLGAVTTSGVNVVTYLSNTNRFQYFGRSFEFLITHLDLVDPTVELRIVPTGHSVRLRKGESVAVRLGNDEVADVRFTFSGLEANQVEMTLAETAHASSVAIPIADPVPFLAPSSGAVLPVGLTRVLRFGMRGEDVRRLQAFLNRQGFLVASTGPGSPGNETTYFGFGTRSALVSFQRKYGLAPFPGFVGERTRIGINRLGR